MSEVLFLLNGYGYTGAATVVADRRATDSASLEQSGTAVFPNESFPLSSPGFSVIFTTADKLELGRADPSKYRIEINSPPRDIDLGSGDGLVGFTLIGIPPPAAVSCSGANILLSDLILQGVTLGTSCPPPQ